MRKCTNPNCSWKGTREEALGPYHREEWRCPECMTKIQSDSDLRYNRNHRKSKEIDKKLADKLINWLSNNGNRFGIKVSRLTKILKTSAKKICQLTIENDRVELIVLGSSSNRVRLKK